MPGERECCEERRFGPFRIEVSPASLSPETRESGGATTKDAFGADGAIMLWLSFKRETLKVLDDDDDDEATTFRCRFRSLSLPTVVVHVYLKACARRPCALGKLELGRPPPPPPPPPPSSSSFQLRISLFIPLLLSLRMEGDVRSAAPAMSTLRRDDTTCVCVSDPFSFLKDATTLLTSLLLLSRPPLLDSRPLCWMLSHKSKVAPLPTSLLLPPLCYTTPSPNLAQKQYETKQQLCLIQLRQLLLHCLRTKLFKRLSHYCNPIPGLINSAKCDPILASTL